MSELDFSNKQVVVVGGSSGIGNGIAHAFRQRGAEVEVWGTRASAADYAGEEGSVLDGLAYQQVDVADPAAIDAATTPDSVDIVVLCQGTVLYKRKEFERDGWNWVMDVNLNSLMDCARKFHRYLVASQGSLQIISSVVAYRASIGNPAYATSKAGAVGLCRTLGEAWASDGIRVNGIAPGFVETKLTTTTFQNEKRKQATLRSIPLRRAGTPDDIAGASLFLASPLAAYVIGQTIQVDGGLGLS